MPQTSPVVPAPGECLLNAADTNQAQPEAGPLFTGDPAGGLFHAVPLTPPPATASHHDGESDAVGGSSEVPDLSREGPFDIHQDHPRSVASPRLLQDNQGCPFRMTSYGEETGGPDFYAGIWCPAPRSASAGVCRHFGVGTANES